MADKSLLVEFPKVMYPKYSIETRNKLIRIDLAATVLDLQVWGGL